MSFRLRSCVSGQCIKHSHNSVTWHIRLALAQSRRAQLENINNFSIHHLIIYAFLLQEDVSNCLSYSLLIVVKVLLSVSLHLLSMLYSRSWKLTQYKNDFLAWEARLANKPYSGPIYFVFSLRILKSTKIHKDLQINCLIIIQFTIQIEQLNQRLLKIW